MGNDVVALINAVLRELEGWINNWRLITRGMCYLRLFGASPSDHNNGVSL